MKKGLIVSAVILILGLSVFVSAFSLSDLFKTTGKVTQNWQISDPNGLCLNYYNTSPNQLCLNFTSGCVMSSPQGCMDYTSQTSCNANSNCTWQDRFQDFSSGYINVTQGWNLLFGLSYPGEISAGNLTPSNIKAIYALDPLTQNYFELYPDSNESSEVALINNLNDYAQIPGSISSLSNYNSPGDLMYPWPSWVYFNDSGYIKYRTLTSTPGVFTSLVSDPTNSNITLTAVALSNIFLGKGWNFIGISPGMFFWGVTPSNFLSYTPYNYFTLYNISGDCDLNNAQFYLYNSQNSGNWIPINQYTLINNSEIGGVIVANMSNSCNLEQNNHNYYAKINGVTGGGDFNLSIQENVSLYNSSSNSLITTGLQAPLNSSCLTSGYGINSSGPFISEPYIASDIFGNFSIATTTVNCNCLDGACVS